MNLVEFRPAFISSMSGQFGLPIGGYAISVDTYANPMATMRVGCTMPTGSLLRFAQSSEIVVQMMAGRSGTRMRSSGGEAPPPSGSGGDGGGRGSRKARRGSDSTAVPEAFRIQELGDTLYSSNIVSDRLNAAISLAQMGEKAKGAEWAISPRLMLEKNPAVLAALLCCAVFIKKVETAFYVSKSLDHTAEAVRSAAAISLGEMGEYTTHNWMACGSGILDKLTNVSLHDESLRVRAAAESALRRLGI